MLPFVVSQFVGKWVLKYATLDLATRFVCPLHFSILMYRAAREKERDLNLEFVPCLYTLVKVISLLEYVG